MKLSDITDEALGLGEKDRAALASRLLDTLSPPDLSQRDGEVDQRDEDLESNTVEPISHTELTRRVQAARSK